MFSGGGTRCLIFLSALERLESAGHLHAVVEWWGTSAGSLVAALLALCSSDIQRVSDVLFDAHFHRFRDINISNLVNISNVWGLDDGLALSNEIENLFDKICPGARHFTLSDVPGFHAVVADLNIYETVVCSATTFPTLKLSDAVRASMSLPLFYRPFYSPVNGHIWIDGGLKAAFPWGCLPSDDAREEALGFAFRRSWIAGPRTFTEYMLCMLHFDDPKRIPEQESRWPRNIMWFDSPPFPAWYVRLREEDVLLLRRMGEKTANDWEQIRLSPSSQERIGNRPSCEDRCIPSQADPVHCTNELLDNPQSSDLALQMKRPFRDLPPYKQPLHRRWSL